MKRAVLVPIGFVAAFMAFAAGLFWITPAADAQPAHTPEASQPSPLNMPGVETAMAQPAVATEVMGRLSPWPTVYPPTQADNGAQVYWARCMMCHGDHGQGLNQDWLSVMDPQDRNCWKSGCHGPHHPSFGFEFPKVVPAVIGTGTLKNFSTGLDVFNFIKLYMPYQDPGGLPDSSYWDLTAYLLRQNGYFDGKGTLDAARASAIQITAGSQPQPPGSNWHAWIPYLAAASVVVLFLIGVLVYQLREKKRKTG